MSPSKKKVDPLDPFDPDGPFDPDLPPFDPATAFNALDENLPLALFPVRLEARFLPDEDPTEIVVRVFPDEIHADAHDPAFTDTELALAQGYWDWVWRVAAEPAGVAEARDWLAAELGPHRAVYVAWASRPDADPPSKPAPPDSKPTPPPKLRPVAHRDSAVPGTARLMPVRWAAFVELLDETAGPFWAANPVTSPLATTPALVDLPDGVADARGFLDSQGLSWTHDLEAAEAAGMVIRIPLAGLPSPPSTGFDRLTVVGVAAGSDHDDAVRTLLDAHRYTRGLELLPPGTPTNVTEDSPDGAGGVDVGALFDAEFARPDEPARGAKAAPPKRPPAEPADPGALLTASPADAMRMALGLAGETAVDLAAAADHPEPSLARAANAALWPATWGKWFTDPMSIEADGSPLLDRDEIDTLRLWFVDFVRAEGPLPTLRVGRHPYGLLPVSVCERREGDSLFEQLESILVDVFDNWFNLDAVAVLDPDASDMTPSTLVAEKASDVGAVYGATPHIRELRLRPVEDTHGELVDLYELRLGFAGLLCALVPTVDGTPFTTAELEADQNEWYEAFLKHEPRARGADGAKGQLDALLALGNDLDISGSPQQMEAGLVIRTYLEPQPSMGDEVITGDVVGIASRHAGRVAVAQRYLAGLGVHDELGSDEAPRLYTGAYGEEGTEVGVDVLVAPGTGDEAVNDLSGWLEEIRQAVADFQSGEDPPGYTPSDPVPLLAQLLQSAAASVARGPAAAGLEQGVDRLRELVDTDGAGAITVLERLMRGTLGLASYRADAWLTGFASERLGVERLKRPVGLQVGGYGWLVNVSPRAGGPTQGHIHAPSLDQATTAAVLRSGWSAFGTAEAGSPLAVDLSSGRVRAARSLIEGVRAGLELGRLLGARFERRLHDGNLDAHLDDVRAAVLTGADQADRPATRTVDGLLLARAYTDGIEQTTVEKDVRQALDPIIAPSAELLRAVEDTVADLDAVSDVLVAQAVHSLLRGDAGVAAPTLAATGSGDSGLPAVDFPTTDRGGRLVTVRVTGVLGSDALDPVWKGAASSVLAAAEPRLERWVGQLLGEPENVAVEVQEGDETQRTDLAVLDLGALDAVYGIDELGGELLGALGAGAEAAIVSGRPPGLGDDELGWDEFVTLARAARTLLGRIRALSSADLDVAPAGTESRDLGDLQARVAAAEGLVPAGDPRHAALRQHRADNPVDTADLLIERLGLLTVHPVPILPLLVAGIPEAVAESFSGRKPLDATAAWLAQAAKVRPDLATFVGVMEMGELVAGRPLLSFALAQTPDAGGPWAAIEEPSAPGPHTAWCNATGAPEDGPVAGFVVDAWTETIPATRTTSGIAVHFDRPSATAPNAVLLAVTRAGQTFDLDYVHQCVRDTLVSAQFRALGSDSEHPFLGQFLPAVFLPGDAVVSTAASGETS